MIINSYAKAYVEVLEIISHFSEKNLNKIPRERIEFYEKNKDSKYKFKINPKIELNKQHISKEASAIIVNIYKDYFATEEQKEKINEVLKINQNRAEQEKKVKFNKYDLFKNNISANNFKKNITQETAIKEYKDNFFIRLKNLIIKLLHKRA